MRNFLFLACLGTSLLSFSVSIPTSASASDKLCDRVGLYGEALTFSHHLSDNGAPPGGYNETNTGASIGAVCKKTYQLFDLNTSLGLIAFKNSYNKTSKGIALGANLSRPVYDRWDAFAGVNIVAVDGYEDLSDDARIGDETGILPAIAIGTSYNFTSNIAFRATANIVPSVGAADGLILPTIGIQYLY